MTKAELMNTLIEDCVEEAPTGMAYISPMWRSHSALAKYDGDLSELREVLELTVKKRNAFANKLWPMLATLENLFGENIEALDEQEKQLANDMVMYILGSRQNWSFAKKEE